MQADEYKHRWDTIAAEFHVDFLDVNIECHGLPAMERH
jgi:hypothetical protein